MPLSARSLALWLFTLFAPLSACLPNPLPDPGPVVDAATLDHAAPKDAAMAIVVDLDLSDLCPGPPSVDLAGMKPAFGCEHFARQWCLRELNCDIFFYRRWSSEGACETDQILHCATVQAALGLGSAAQLDTCATEIDTLTCSLLAYRTFNNTLCTIPPGAAAIGNACKVDADCQSIWCSQGFCALPSMDYSHCVKGTCSRGFSCPQGSTCIHQPGYNGRCAIGIQVPLDRQCAPPYDCCIRGAAGGCIEPARLGEYCSQDVASCRYGNNQCESCCSEGLECDLKTYKCVRAGGTCH